MMINLEVCSNSVTSALAAQEGGAFRVELCENLHEGGTTPSAGQLALARKLLNIKLYVLIRPRSGDFLYTDVEFDIIMADIQHCADIGCDGVVIGILKADGSIDVERCRKAADLARKHGLGVTFHRAFDMCNDQFKALEGIIELGCERILTSGGRSTAMEGITNVAQLVKRAAGRIAIMPGSGINENNVADLVKFTGVTEVHSSARIFQRSKMEYLNDHILLSDNQGDEYTIDVSSADKVRKIIAAANS